MHKSLTLLHTLTLLYRKVQQRLSSKIPVQICLVWFGSLFPLKIDDGDGELQAERTCSEKWNWSSSITPKFRAVLVGSQCRWTKLDGNILWDSRIGWEYKELSFGKIELKVSIRHETLNHIFSLWLPRTTWRPGNLVFFSKPLYFKPLMSRGDQI